MFDRVVRFSFSIFGIILSLRFLFIINAWLNGHLTENKILGLILMISASIGFGALFYFLAGIVIHNIEKAMEKVWIIIQSLTIYELVFCTFGLISGLVVANLLSATISNIPFIGYPAAIASDILFGALGIHIANKKRKSIYEGIYKCGVQCEAASRDGNIPVCGHDSVSPNGSGTKPAKPKILDTSVIIDGRIVDICKTGFIEGPLVIPGIVLEELRHIADSSDNLKRNRGRRGLDVLNIIQKDLNIPVEIYESKVEDEWEVDIKLLKIAQRLQGAVLTNDFNLNKVASVHRVPVLNINELANALKPIVLPGEEMIVSVIKNGKESGQGIGYLDDGTMIVVEGGRRHMGEELGVVVTSVLQTAAGRMIFAKPKYQMGKAI